MDEEFSRKRVAKACQRCRAMKCKCDGEQPTCGRCKGYGYTCVFRLQRPRQRTGPSRFNDDFASQLPELCDAMAEQEALLDQTIALLPTGSQKKTMISKRSLIRGQLDQAISTIGPRLASQAPSPSLVDTSPGYVGEVSDIGFVNLVKRVLQSNEGGLGDDEFQSYDQGEGTVPNSAVAYNGIQLPSAEEADKYIDAYFSTIHVAYPFIPEKLFRAGYAKLCDQEQSKTRNSVETALAYTICAIGAYYRWIAESDKDQDSPHEKFFSYSITLAPTANIERSTTQVSLLLARCFYLLVVCRTESCWTILGQAARAAQSIGMHVESNQLENQLKRNAIEAEKRRRIWYSIYVLDRLLSLQLGRPPAIHEEDYNVPLPSRTSDKDIDWDGKTITELQDEESVGDYFLATIAFSEIVGSVLRSLYCPRRSHVASDDLDKTKDLDGLLLQWKLSLPRTLRFDVGHTFEKSPTFKRQRNMLGIKYHHLRALIYRPYLCHLLLTPESTVAETDWNLISAYERTCIMEAQETARLLYGISSKEDLVHNFPWWQMISCLVCASSILLVSSIFAPADTDLDTTGLSDDAETCLRVFDALSSDSPGARIARDMMNALKECGARWSTQAGQARIDATGMNLDDVNFTANLYWPAEIVDSMAWSAQFFDVGSKFDR